MRRLLNLSAVLLLIAMPVVLTAQVKQVFQVLDFDTKQPVAGVTTTLFGQALTTNAQGVAVANLPADKKEAFLPLEQWKKEGCTYLGRTPESFFSFFQSKDTIKFYMAEKQKYRDAGLSVFKQLYQHFYEQQIMPTSQEFRDSIKAGAASVPATANALVESTFRINDIVKTCFSDASDIQKYESYQFDKPQFNEVLARARKGEVNEAVAKAKEHVRLDDNSRENLEWIEFYRYLRSLDLSDEDEDPISRYSAILYGNHYGPYSNVDYINDLNRESRFETADSVARIEKPGNRHPRYNSAFEPSFIQYIINQDRTKVKATAEQQLDNAQRIYGQYPCFQTLGDLFWTQKNLYYAYAFLDDSLSATRAIDSALVLEQKLLSDYAEDSYDRNQHLIKYHRNLLDVMHYNLACSSQATLYQLYDDIYEASLESYRADTSNLFLQLQLAENAVQWLQNVPDVEGRADKQKAVLGQLAEVEFKLSETFPEFYAVQNLQVTSQLLGTCLVSQSGQDELRQAFRQYERSYDVLNAVFPNAFNETYLNYNATLETYLTAFQQFALASELSAFTDRLISIEAKNDPQAILTKKAEYANHLAESLYKNEMYEESVAYYLQSNELYEKAIPQDEQLWLPYLNNYLQMGDAHLNLNQYDKAVMTYQKVLDFEPQIPASVIPQYTTMKGSVYYYVGDVYKSTGEMARAEKAYKTAEKHFKKAISLGESEAYALLGEMFWGKAVLAAQEENMKKCRQLVEQSVAYYEKSQMERPYHTYERAKSVMGDFYKEAEDAANYYKTMADLTDYYRKYVEYDQEYPLKLLQNAETVLNSGRVGKEEALQYSHDILNGLMYLNDQGHDVKLAYLRGVFNMARVYLANDSVSQAIALYRDCIQASEILYADTALSTHKGNLVEIYAKMAECYEQMAEEIDTAHSERWYYRAADTRDTLIDLMKEINTDGDVNLTYRTAMQYKNNGVVFYHLDMVPSAQDYFDKSNELLLMLYNSEYKAEVESDVIRNYYFKGVIYAEGDNSEKAVSCLRKAVEYGEKSEQNPEAAQFTYLAIDVLIQQLGKADASANAAEIAKLKKTAKSLESVLKKSN